jgi:hypothetical protein
MVDFFETDWLGSRPVFYNEYTKKIDYKFNNVIDYDNIKFNPEGFNNYLDWGFSVFNQSPIEGIKFLKPNSIIHLNDQNELCIEEKPDPVKSLIDFKLSEKDTLDLIKEKVNSWEKSFEGEIIIPTSGGFDSRLLNFFIENKNRVRAFTFGTSLNQDDSFEVVHAKALSESLNIKWEQIKLGDFHNYFSDWIDLFGLSMHAHGMYQVEFYKEITKRINDQNLLSGIIGWGWAGINVPKIENIHDLSQLNFKYAHKANSEMSLLGRKHDIINDYYLSNKEIFSDRRLTTILLYRNRIIWESYLTNLPRFMGFNAWSPFLDIEVAMAMLNIDPERGKGKKWLKDFFIKNNIDVDTLPLKKTYQNDLNYYAMRKIPLRPLNSKLLSPYIDTKYVNWINSRVSQISNFWDGFYSGFSTNKILRRIPNPDNRMEAYSAYLTLKPINELLEKING